MAVGERMIGMCNGHATVKGRVPERTLWLGIKRIRTGCGPYQHLERPIMRMRTVYSLTGKSSMCIV